MRRVERGAGDPAPLFRHGDRAGAAARGLLDFSVTVNPLGPPLAVVWTLREGLGAVRHYPDPECRALAERLGALHDCSPDQVVVGNGANDLIYLVTRTVRPRRVALVEPTYTEYLRAALAVGAEVSHWLAEGDDFRPAPFDPCGADLVWVGSPNNPTGQVWPPDELASWVRSHPHTLFAVDEAFLPLALAPAAATGSLAGQVGCLPNLIVVRSLTKLYALPGLRLGYAVAPPAWATRLKEQAVPWSVNALAQAAGLAALADEVYRMHTRAWLDGEARPFANHLARASTHCHPIASGTSFVLVQLAGQTSAEVARRLLGRGIAVRDASNFVGLDARFVRIAARTAEDNERLLEALAEL